MQIWHSENDVPDSWSACVVTIGVFDGMHIGHQKIIHRAVEIAKDLGIPSVLVTFDPHPRAVLGNVEPPYYLATLAYRAQLARECGIDIFFIKNFTAEFARISSRQFIVDFLVEKLKVKSVVVGENFRFGARAAGDCALLTTYGHDYGFTIHAVPLVGDSEKNYSATKVRTLLSQGEVDSAANILGRLYRLEGRVVHGYARGRILGFPTANLNIDSGVVIPQEGVYAGWFTILESLTDRTLCTYPPAPVTSENSMESFHQYPCAISVGTNPTFDDMGKPIRSVEAYVIDASADLYDLYVSIDFVRKIRGQNKFNSTYDLIAAMTRDVTAARTILGK